MLTKGDWRRLPTRGQRLLAQFTLLQPYLQAVTFLAIPVGITVAATGGLPLPVALLTFTPLVPTIATVLFEAAALREFGQSLELPVGARDYARLRAVGHPVPDRHGLRRPARAAAGGPGPLGLGEDPPRREPPGAHLDRRDCRMTASPDTLDAPALAPAPPAAPAADRAPGLRARLGEIPAPLLAAGRLAAGRWDALLAVVLALATAPSTPSECSASPASPTTRGRTSPRPPPSRAAS